MVMWVAKSIEMKVITSTPVHRVNSPGMYWTWRWFILLHLCALFLCTSEASGVLFIEEEVTQASTTAHTITTSTTPNPVQKTYNRVIFTVVSSLSAFGSVAIIVTYFIWHDLQTTTRRILVYISIGDFLCRLPITGHIFGPISTRRMVCHVNFKVLWHQHP